MSHTVTDAKYARRKWRSGSVDLDLPSLLDEDVSSSSAWIISDDRLTPAPVRWSGSPAAPLLPTSQSLTGSDNSSAQFYDKVDEVGAVPDHRSSDTSLQHPATFNGCQQQQQQNLPREELRDATPPTTTMQPDITDSNLQAKLYGFRECAAETLRYLTEVEGLSADDPMVRGLVLHLRAYEQRVFLQDAMRHLVACGGDNDSAFQSGDEDDDFSMKDVDEEDEEADDADMFDEGARLSFYDDGDHIHRSSDSMLTQSLTLLMDGYLPMISSGTDGRWPDLVTSTSTSSDDEGSDISRPLSSASPAPSL